MGFDACPHLGRGGLCDTDSPRQYSTTYRPWAVSSARARATTLGPGGHGTAWVLGRPSGAFAAFYSGRGSGAHPRYRYGSNLFLLSCRCVCHSSLRARLLFVMSPLEWYLGACKPSKLRREIDLDDHVARSLQKKIPGNAMSPIDVDAELVERTMRVTVASEQQPAAPLLEQPPEAQRVAHFIAALKPTLAGSELRRALVEELHSLLSRVSETGAKPVQSATARAFADAEGPQVLIDIERSMRGQWHLDAKNGTLSRITKIFELPGAVCKASKHDRARTHSDQIEQSAAACTDKNCCWAASPGETSSLSLFPGDASLTSCQRSTGEKSFSLAPGDDACQRPPARSRIGKLRSRHGTRAGPAAAEPSDTIGAPPNC